MKKPKTLHQIVSIQGKLLYEDMHYDMRDCIATFTEGEKFDCRSGANFNNQILSGADIGSGMWESGFRLFQADMYNCVVPYETGVEHIESVYGTSMHTRGVKGSSKRR